MLQNQVIYRKTCALRIGRDRFEIMIVDDRDYSPSRTHRKQYYE